MSSPLPNTAIPATVENVKQAIEKARLDKGMSYRGVAAAANVAHGTYWAWLNSDKEHEASFTNVAAYANAVGLKLTLTAA